VVVSRSTYLIVHSGRERETSTHIYIYTHTHTHTHTHTYASSKLLLIQKERMEQMSGSKQEAGI